MSLPAPSPGARAVVTGASSGIGRALAWGLARRGHSLLLVARRADALEQLGAELSARHRIRVEVRCCDLADRVARGRLAAELESRHVSVLCSNAGFANCEALVATDPGREAREVEVNAVALHELTLAVLPGMVSRRCGSILITGSIAGGQPVPTAATYAATKAFANTLGEALHEELRGTGVNCTVVAPGPVRTAFYSVGGLHGAERNRWFGWSSAEQVASEALTALERGRRLAVPGVLARLQGFAGRHTPRRIVFVLLRLLILPAMRADALAADAPSTAAPPSRPGTPERGHEIALPAEPADPKPSRPVSAA